MSADPRPLAVQVGWLAAGFSVPDREDVAELLGREPEDPEFLDAWRAAGLGEPGEELAPW